MIPINNYDEWLLSLTKSQIDHIIEQKGKALSKWTPVLENLFSDMNISNKLLEDMCIYTETYAMYEAQLILSLGSSQLPDKLKDLHKKIIEINKGKKSTIIRKVYNYETGFSEYELEDGNFVKILPNGKIEPPTSDIFKILPKSLLKLTDPQEYRNQQIEEIL
jgi:hypothetical protein